VPLRRVSWRWADDLATGIAADLRCACLHGHQLLERSHQLERAGELAGLRRVADAHGTAEAIVFTTLYLQMEMHCDGHSWQRLHEKRGFHAGYRRALGASLDKSLGKSLDGVRVSIQKGVGTERRPPTSLAENF